MRGDPPPIKQNRIELDKEKKKGRLELIAHKLLHSYTGKVLTEAEFEEIYLNKSTMEEVQNIFKHVPKNAQNSLDESQLVRVFLCDFLNCVQKFTHKNLVTTGEEGLKENEIDEWFGVVCQLIAENPTFLLEARWNEMEKKNQSVQYNLMPFVFCCFAH